MSTSNLNRTIAVLAIAAIPSAALVIADGAAAKSAKSATVTLKNIKFNPGKVTIARGGSVKWVWKDGSTGHNVTIKGGKHSPTKSSGSFTVRFSKKGTYRYSCTIHSGMNGRVVVR